MNSRLSFLLLIGALFHFNNGMAQASRVVLPVAPTRPTRELTKDEMGSSGNGTKFHCGMNYFENQRMTSRNRPGSTWERFHVYMGPSITDSQRDMVNRALYELSQVVCVPFGIWPVDSRPSGDYVNVTNMDGWCGARLGRKGGEQEFNFQANCWSYSNVLHDFMHSLGVDHEHSRGDRDDFITVHWDNIMDEFKFAFQKELYGPIPTFGVRYNPRSLTHYPSRAYAKDYRKPAISMKNGGLIGENDKLQDSDKELLRRMYKCR